MQALFDWWQYRLCDVFIELVKPAMQSPDEQLRDGFRQTLWTCLDAGLRCARPCCVGSEVPYWPTITPGNFRSVIVEFPPGSQIFECFCDFTGKFDEFRDIFPAEPSFLN